MTDSPFECFHCEHDCEVGGLATCSNATRCWKGTFRAPGTREQHLRGCFTEAEQVRIYCDSGRQKDQSIVRIECCAYQFCNDGAFPILDTLKNQTDTPTNSMDPYKFLFWETGIIALLVILAFIYNFIHLRKKRPNIEQRYKMSELQAAAASNDSRTMDYSSLLHGSDSDSRVTIPPTVSQQIILNMNYGSFGSYELWRGTYQQDKSVMVKIYSLASESLWAHEIEVYTKHLPTRPNNILGYLGNDTVGLGHDRRLWLVTDDHPNGSLVNYLKVARLNQIGMLNAICSLMCGLAQLHDVNMAHRNLSSKTVFVRDDWQCVIGGLEHSITQKRLDQADFLEHASKRYMSPELLDPGFTRGEVSTFQEADIYSLGIILWEICRMCVEDDNVVLDYAAPFSEWLADDEEPTVEKMRELVLVEKRRPAFPDRWNTLPYMLTMKTMIEKCWDEDPEKRVMAVRVKETLRNTSL